MIYPSFSRLQLKSSLRENILAGSEKELNLRNFNTASFHELASLMIQISIEYFLFNHPPRDEDHGFQARVHLNQNFKKYEYAALGVRWFSGDETP